MGSAMLWKSCVASRPQCKRNKSFKQAAKQSVGKVRDFRKAFADFFDGLKRDRLDLTNWPAEWHEPFRALEQIKYTMWGMSDSVVIAVPLSGNDEHWKDINGFLDQSSQSASRRRGRWRAG